METFTKVIFQMGKLKVLENIIGKMVILIEESTKEEKDKDLVN